MKILKCLLMIVTAPVILVLTLFVWLCTGLIYISGLVLGLLSTVIALLGVAVLITYSPQNGVILLVMAFLWFCIFFIHKLTPESQISNSVPCPAARSQPAAAPSG